MDKNKGWKTITGAIIYGLAHAAIAMATSDGLPTAYPEFTMWLNAIGLGLKALGGPLAFVGIGHKVLKAQK